VPTLSAAVAASARVGAMFVVPPPLTDRPLAPRFTVPAPVIQYSPPVLSIEIPEALASDETSGETGTNDAGKTASIDASGGPAIQFAGVSQSTSTFAHVVDVPSARDAPVRADAADASTSSLRAIRRAGVLGLRKTSEQLSFAAPIKPAPKHAGT